MLTKLYQDLPKIVWVSGPNEKSNVADSSLVFRLTSKIVFLDIGHSLQHESKSEENDTGNVSSSAECWLRISGNIWGIQNGYRQRYCPDPDHLEDPKA